MKKILSVIAALFAVLVLWCAVTVFAAELPFSDVKEKAWYYEYVKESYEKGYMEGKPGGLFAPSESVTRAQYVTILARLCDATEDTDTGFTDVGAKKWYAGAVGWAVKAGIVTGYEDNTFRGDNSISRQELMVMTSRYLDYIWTDLPASDTAIASFADAGKIAKWAADYVDEMRAVGLVEGDANGNFNPKKTATRAEIATMTVRLGRALAAYEGKATIGGTDLSAYSIYSSCLNAEQLASVAETIKDTTGVELAVSETMTDKAIVFAVDESLKMLQYSITEKDGALTFAVNSSYATAYLPEIVEDAIALRDSFNIPKDFAGTGVFAIDEAPTDGSAYLLVETDKNPLTYDLGEDATFRISIISNGKLVSIPQFAYKYNYDYTGGKDGTAPGISGQCYLTFKGLDKPGSLYLQVFAANRKGQKMTSLNLTLNTSVVYDFENVTYAVEKPADFDSFWDAEIEKLMAVEPTAISCVECEHCKQPGFKVYAVEIQSLGTVASAHISYPENAAPGSLIIAGQFDGYGSVASNFAAYNNSAIVVAVNRHEVKDHQDDQYYKDYEKSIEGWGFDNPTREESYFYGMIMRDIQALRYATVAFADLWDGKTMTVSGGSMGGFQSIAVAGLYDKVTVCYPGVPWMGDVGGYTEGRVKGGFFPEYSEGSKYYDSAYFAERFNGIAAINAGMGDGTCPTSGTASIYNAFKCQKSITYGQVYEHGAVAGVSGGTYVAASDVAEMDEMRKDLTDPGLAVTPPDYSGNRTLNASEQKMKESIDLYTKNVRWITAEFQNSPTVTAEAVSALIKDALVTKCGLDAKYNVVIDEDSISTLRSEYGLYVNGQYFFYVDYMVTDDEGGFVDAVARMLITKNAKTD